MSAAGVPRVILGVRRFLDGPSGPQQGSHGVIAVSGGADSTALTLALRRLAPPRSLRLTIGHVDHELRVTSADDAAWVERFGGELGVPVLTVRAPVDPGAAVEANARRQRYAALRRIAEDVGATWIATAHTRDDQVETILMRLARGADRRGLGGIRRRRGAIMRPMLDVTRADVRWYLGSLGVRPREDPSNGDLRFTRNRLRHLVVPLLEREVRPNFGVRLAALADRLRDEDDLLASLAAARGEALIQGDVLRIGVGAEPVALARRVAKAWLRLVGCVDVGSRHIEAVLRLAHGEGAAAISVPGGRVVRTADALRFERKKSSDCW